MTTDLALAALKSWIESKAATTHPTLSGISIFLRDTLDERPGDDDDEDAADFDATLIVLRDESAEEHEVLRGVLKMELQAILISTPNSELGKTDAQHRALAATLYDVLADVGAVQFCENYAGFKCWDIRGVSPISETGDGERRTTFGFSMVGAASN